MRVSLKLASLLGAALIGTFVVCKHLEPVKPIDPVAPKMAGSLAKAPVIAADGFTDLTLKFEKRAVVAALEAKLGRLLEGGEVLKLKVCGLLNDETEFCGSNVIIIRRK